MTSLAEYNNNPGNIRPAKGVTYEGLLGVDEKGFGIFEKPEYGQKALINDLTHKLEKRGIKTPAEFVDIYAPAGKENTEEARDNYKIYIAQKFGLKSTSDPFPENSVDKLAQAVTSFEGGTWQEKPKEETKDEPTDGATAGTKIVDPKDEIKDPPKGLDNQTDPYAVVGGVTGASVASSLETGKKALPLLQNLYDKATGSTEFMNRPQSRGGLQRYLNSQLNENIRMPLKEFEKVANQGNPVRTMKEVQAAIENLHEVPEQKITKPVYKPQSYGSKTLIDTGKITPSTIPGKPAIDLSKYTHTPTMATRVADQAVNAGQVVKGALPSLGRIGLGGFGGAMAGVQGYEAWELAQKLKEMKDPSWQQYMRLASKTAATAGGVASMFPFGVTQVGGAILQAPELAWSAYDYLNQPKEAQTPKGGLSGQ